SNPTTASSLSRTSPSSTLLPRRKPFPSGWPLCWRLLYLESLSDVSPSSTANHTPTSTTVSSASSSPKRSSSSSPTVS
ncbi:hypothetical protein BGZ91_009525, partial [Linnemannia elongata]